MIPTAAEPGLLDARHVPFDSDKHKIVLSHFIAGKMFWIDGTHRHEWHLGMREPLPDEKEPMPEALRWRRAGHDAQRVTILDGFRAELAE